MNEPANRPAVSGRHAYSGLSRDPILIAASGQDAAGLARLLLEEGRSVSLRSSLDDLVGSLIPGCPAPGLVIIDPLEMAPALPGLCAKVPAVTLFAATGERRPARLIEAINSGLYSGWFSRPLDAEEIMPVVAETLRIRRLAQVEQALASDLFNAARDMMRAAYGQTQQQTGEAEASKQIEDALDIAYAIEDYRGLLDGSLFLCPVTLPVSSLIRPVVQRWEKRVAYRKLDFRQGKVAPHRLSVDAPLVRRALALMLRQGEVHAGQCGLVTLAARPCMASPELEIAVRSERGSAGLKRVQPPFQALSETFCKRVAELHGGRFCLDGADHKHIQRLTLSL